jgi:3-hydroxyisobutyrate dehydrogenase-like beta-hydroxyacid dehydrogenase
LSETKVGFIGLGRMGSAIAGRIADAGYDLTIWNRSPGKAGDLVGRGAQEARSLADVCPGRDVAITMVADDNALREVALGPDGIAASLPAGAIHVAMGTHGVAAIAQVAAAHQQAGQSLVAAPVLGRPDVAAAGGLGIVAGGPAAAVEAVLPLLDAIGRHTFSAGERPESASAIKLANNFLLGCAIEALAEAFALGRRYDVEPEILHEVLTEGLFSAPAYKVYGQIMVDSDYDRVGFTTSLALKDIELTMAAASAAAVPLPSGSALRDRLLAAIAQGDGERDWAVLAREQARASGLHEPTSSRA